MDDKAKTSDYSDVFRRLIASKYAESQMEAVLTGAQPGAQRAHPTTAVGQFTVSKISNGYLVECRSAGGNDVQLHYAEDLKVVGELIAGTSKRWVPQGEDK